MLHAAGATFRRCRPTWTSIPYPPAGYAGCRMSQPDPFNPYAPPQRREAPVERAPRAGHGHDASSIQAALRDLEVYTSDPGALAQDLATAGPRVRVITWAAVGLFVLGGVLA